MFFMLDGDSGALRLIEASTSGYKELASAKILAAEGGEVWGPLALSNGRLVIRDAHQMVCLQVGPTVAGK
jgi:outer membrane protein assembly factor BamB